MAEPKTKPTAASVDAFLERISDQVRREDCFTLLRIMKQVTRAEPKMWGSSIVGFGTYTIVYAGGREGEWPAAAFAPRKQDLTLYIGSGFPGHAALLKKLGKHKGGKGCLYIKRLEDVDLKALKELIRQSVRHRKKK